MFFVFCFPCEKDFRLSSEGSLDYRALARALSHWVISTVIRAIWIPFFYFHVWKVFSLNGTRLASWMEYSSGILQRLMEAKLAFVFYHILWEQVSSKCTVAKITKNLLVFFLLLIFASLIIIT